MNRNEREKVLRDLHTTNYGKALKEVVIEKLIELNDLNKIEDYDDFRAKKEAKKMLKSIFRYLKIKESDIKEQTKAQYE